MSSARLQRPDPGRLTALRQASLAMLDGHAETALRAQSHPELSPMLWHVGHVFFVENYWIAERVFGDRQLTDAWRELYFPELCAKDSRASRLPGPAALRAWADEVSRANDAHWARAADHEHALLADGYLAAFVVQHYAQHLETMGMALAQLAARGDAPGVRLHEAVAPRRDPVSIAAHDTPIGTDAIEAYDNEQPAFHAHVPAFTIERRPVSNAEFLGFIEAGGYQNPSFWDRPGWQWRCEAAITHPQHWRPLPDGWRLAADEHGGTPVHGLSWYEARAFARYADARLPREIEWEAARRADRLEGLYGVWEWCADAFAPYEGFSAFPYDGYSMPWFDGAHFVARGGSAHTRDEIRRPGFRNFYPPGHRHVFAGLRLAR